MHRNTEEPLYLCSSVDRWLRCPAPFFQTQIRHEGPQDPLVCSKVRSKHHWDWKTCLTFLHLRVDFCKLFLSNHFGDKRMSEDQAEWIGISSVCVSLQRWYKANLHSVRDPQISNLSCAIRYHCWFYYSIVREPSMDQGPLFNIKIPRRSFPLVDQDLPDCTLTQLSLI